MYDLIGAFVVASGIVGRVLDVEYDGALYVGQCSNDHPRFYRITKLVMPNDVRVLAR
jgi:hypothetical protein